MEEVEAIVSEILAKANEQAAAIRKKADDDFQSAKDAADAKKDAALAEIDEKREENEAETVRRRTTLAGLESRLTILGAKQELCSKVYDLAAAKLASLDGASYRKLFSALVVKHVEDGDVLFVAAGDKNRLTEKWSKDVIAASGKKASFSAESFAAKGGVLLRGKACEKDLSVETLLEEAREKTEKKVMEILFG